MKISKFAKICTENHSELTVQSGTVRVLKRQAGILQNAERRMTLSLVIEVMKLRELGSI